MNPDKEMRERTLRELAALGDMVVMPDGSLMPARLVARGDLGWSADRDSTDLARLAELVRNMDESVDRWLTTSDTTHEEDERIMGLWLEISRIIRS